MLDLSKINVESQFLLAGLTGRCTEDFELVQKINPVILCKLKFLLWNSDPAANTLLNFLL